MKRNEAKSAKRSLWMMAGLGIALLATTGQAQADDWAFRIGFGGGAYPARHVRVVHERPAYEYVTRQIWVEPIYEEHTVRVDVPPVYEERVVAMRDRYGRIIGHRTVREMVQEGRIEYRTERVLVREGYFKTVTLEVPAAGYVTHSVVGYGGPGLHVGFGYSSHHGRHPRPFRPIRVGHRY